MSEEKIFKWYVLRAISGKENKVQEYIEIEMHKAPLKEYVSKVLIPTEKVYAIQNGKKVVKERSYLPGYVLIEAYLTREIAGYLRNIPNVLGFLGATPIATEPIPLRPAEVARILGSVDDQTDGAEEILVPYIVGESVKVISGPFSGFSGVVEEVNNEKKKLKVMVKIFERKTPLEVSFVQVEKE